jgi:hypothetical protein
MDTSSSFLSSLGWGKNTIIMTLFFNQRSSKPSSEGLGEGRERQGNRSRRI